MTKIEWTEKTWNPLAGCSLVSAGCKNCYAMRTAHRLAQIEKTQAKYTGTTKLVNGKPVWTGKINFDESALTIPLRRKKPTMYFVNSMSDLFHEDVPFDFIRRTFDVMNACPRHTFQVLTKRPHVAAAFAPRLRWTSNIWLGTSVENQKQTHRIDALNECMAAVSVRFLSLEPLLGPIDLSPWIFLNACGCLEPDVAVNPQDCPHCHGSGTVAPFDWVIVGGESGPGARPMHPDWARSIRDQCVAAGVPFFFKQWGAWFPALAFRTHQHWVQKANTHVERGDTCLSADGRHCEIGRDFAAAEYPVVVMRRLGKKAAGRILEDRTWDEMPRVGEEVSHG